MTDHVPSSIGLTSQGPVSCYYALVSGGMLRQEVLAATLKQVGLGMDSARPRRDGPRQGGWSGNSWSNNSGWRGWT